MSKPPASEARTAEIAAMGESLGSLYSELWQSLALIHFYWNEYIVLFGTKPERIGILNRTAPFFFRMLQDELWENSLLHVARMTDPSKSVGRKDRTNLTIQALPELIAHRSLKDEVRRLIDNVMVQTEFCRDWRNRRIAHRDLKLALQQPTTQLANASRSQFKAALASIAEVLNTIQRFYLDSETFFDAGGPLGGALSLLDYLDMCIRARVAQQKRLEEGTPLEEDFMARSF